MSPERHMHLAEKPPTRPHGARTGIARWIGNGVVSGAADDDPSAIGTYASVGARYGLSSLWLAPVLLPMMFFVMYVTAKLGRVYGKGLFGAMMDRFPRKVVYPLAVVAVVGNVIEAAANLGGVGAAVNLLLPLPGWLTVLCIAVLATGLQVLGSYDLLRRIFRWLALALFAYIGAALLARPDGGEVLRGTFIPTIHWEPEFIAMMVACIGTSLSAYIYTWQSNQAVEERRAEGKERPTVRQPPSTEAIDHVRRDAMTGVAFSNVILYFILMSTGATLYASGHHDINSAADAAKALEPIAGPGARWLFALGVIGVGLLAFPVMTTGAAYDVVQIMRRPGSLHATPSRAPTFYLTIVIVTVAAVGLNLIGFNPMRALVWSGIVQGFSVPPLLVAIMLMTGDRRMMGKHVNGRFTTTLGWCTTTVTAAAAIALVVLWASGHSG
jgi:Mn2+/Fe2+ NRAMP family transporter